MSDKIKPVKFTITDHEGEELGLCKDYETWQELRDATRQILKHNGMSGYIKTFIVVHYEDGETYSCRLDIGDSSPANGADLGTHMVDYLEFNAGLKKPDWMTKQDYKEYFALIKPEEVNYAKMFLASYEIVSIV